MLAGLLPASLAGELLLALLAVFLPTLLAGPLRPALAAVLLATPPLAVLPSTLGALAAVLLAALGPVLARLSGL